MNSNVLLFATESGGFVENIAPALVAFLVLLLANLIGIGTVFGSIDDNSRQATDPTGRAIRQQENSMREAHSISIIESGIADSGGGHSLYALVKSEEGTNLTLLWVGGSKQQTYLLEHATPYPNSTLDKFRDILSMRLKRQGIALGKTTLGNLTSLSGSIVIIPTTFFPAELNDGALLDGLAAKNNTMVFLGKQFDYLIDGEGSLVLNPTGTAPKSALQILQINSTIADEENQNLPNFKTANKIAEDIAYGRFGTVYAAADFALVNGTKIIYAQAGSEPQPGTGTAGAGKIINKNTLGAYYFEPQAYSGKLKNPNSAYQGKTQVEFTTANSYNESLVLEFTLKVWDAQKAVATANLGKSLVKQAYFSSAAIELAPGDYLLKVFDQYGTAHAASLLHVKRITFAADNTGMLHIYEDGKPYRGVAEIATGYGIASVQVDGALMAGEGVAVRVHGTEFQPGNARENSTLAFYYTYGPIALVIVAAICLFARPGAGKTYKLRMPALARPKKKVTIALDKFRALMKELCRRPAHLTEVIYKLNEHLSRERMITVDESSVLRIMGALEFMKSYDDYYFYSETGNGENGARAEGPEEAFETEYIERRLRDLAIVNGMRTPGSYEKNGNAYELFPYPKLPGKIGLAGNALLKIAVFKNKAGADAFRETIANGPDPRLRLALANGALLLMGVEEVGKWLEE